VCGLRGNSRCRTCEVGIAPLNSWCSRRWPLLPVTWTSHETRIYFFPSFNHLTSLGRIFYQTWRRWFSVEKMNGQPLRNKWTHSRSSGFRVVGPENSVKGRTYSGCSCSSRTPPTFQQFYVTRAVSGDCTMSKENYHFSSRSARISSSLALWAMLSIYSCCWRAVFSAYSQLRNSWACWEIPSNITKYVGIELSYLHDNSSEILALFDSLLPFDLGLKFPVVLCELLHLGWRIKHSRTTPANTLSYEKNSTKDLSLTNFSWENVNPPNHSILFKLSRNWLHSSAKIVNSRFNSE